MELLNEGNTKIDAKTWNCNNTKIHRGNRST